MAPLYCATLQAIPSCLQGHVFTRCYENNNCVKIVSMNYTDLERCDFDTCLSITCATAAIDNVCLASHAATSIRSIDLCLTVYYFSLRRSIGHSIAAWHFEASTSLVVPILSSMSCGKCGIAYTAGGNHVSMKGLASRPWLPCNIGLYSSPMLAAFVIAKSIPAIGHIAFVSLWVVSYRCGTCFSYHATHDTLSAPGKPLPWQSVPGGNRLSP